MCRRACGVVRTDAHQAVHAVLAVQVAVGVGAAHREGGALDARFFAVLAVEELDVVALLLRPAQVHAHQHLGPVLRLGAAGAGVDREDRVLVVVGTRELELELERPSSRAEPLDEAFELGVGLALGDELAPGRELFPVGAQAVQGSEPASRSDGAAGGSGRFRPACSRSPVPAFAGRCPAGRPLGRPAQRYPRKVGAAGHRGGGDRHLGEGRLLQRARRGRRHGAPLRAHVLQGLEEVPRRRGDLAGARRGRRRHQRRDDLRLDQLLLRGAHAKASRGRSRSWPTRSPIRSSTPASSTANRRS